MTRLTNSARAEFWEAMRTGEPVDRPVELEEHAPVEHEALVVEILVGQLHMSAEQIEGLSEEEAIELVHKHWSRERR
ncbi:MAG: hypothetical protein ACRDL1_06970 [Solirubrobacterales bacterium]